MGWPRRLTALGGRGEAEGEAPLSACLCLTTGGGLAAASIATGGSLCACLTVSGGNAGNLAACLCATVSGGAADAQVTCLCATVSGGAATPRVACVCATASGGGANIPTACVCATASGGTASGQVGCRCATQSGGTATANTAPAAFANGYAARRRVVLEAMPPPDLPAETLADFPQPIPGALLAGLFKDAAHAGRVQSSAGWDVRVEIGGDNPTGTGGTKLDHHLASYDPAAGTPFLFARHQRQSAVREVLFVYYGKAGLSASEANPAGAWSAALAARFWTPGALGVDVKGLLSFGTLSGITTAGVTVAGLPGARLVAASFARLTPIPTSSPIAGIGAVTTHYLAKWTAPFPTDGNGERVGGAGGGTADFSQFVASGVLNSGWIPEDTPGHRGGQNNSAALTTAGDVDAGNVHSWHFTNQSGQDSHIWRDGVLLPTTFSGTTQKTVGTIGIDGTENDSLGAGTGAQTTAIPGDYGPSVIYSKVPSRTWIAAYDRCLLDPLAWMGVGAEELPGDAAGSPVAMPAPATVTAGAQSDIDVAAPAFVPTGATAPALSTVGTAADGGGPAHGSVATASGKARLLEDSKWVGPDRFGFTLTAGGKLLVPARSIVDVRGAVAGGVLAAWPRRAALLASGDSNRTNVTAKAGLSFTAAAGVQHVVTGDIASIGTVTIGGGTLGQTCYLRGKTDSLNPADWPVISGGTIQISAKSLVICQLQLRNVQIKPLSGCKKLQTECLWWSDLYFPNKTDAAAENGCILVDEQVQCDGILMAYNWYRASSASTNINGAFFRMHGAPDDARGRLEVPANCTNIIIYRNHIHKMTGGGNSFPTNTAPKGNLGNKVLYMGDNDRANCQDINMLILENLVTQHGNYGNFIECKFAGMTAKNNTLEVGVPVDPDGYGHHDGTLEIRNRHGRKTKDPTKAVGVGLGNVATGNLFVFRAGYAGNMQINWRDGYGVVTNNWGVTLADNAQPAVGTAANGNFEIWVQRGNRDWTGYPDNEQQFTGSAGPSTGKALFGGNRATVKVGVDAEGSSPPAEFDPTGNVIATATARTDRNFALVKDPTYAGTNDYASPVPGADYNLVPRRLQSPENGFAGTPEAGPPAYDPSQYGPPA